MLGKLWKAAAVSLTLILTSSVTVGAVTVNFGTAAAVATEHFIFSSLWQNPKV